MPAVLNLIEISVFISELKFFEGFPSKVFLVGTITILMQVYCVYKMIWFPELWKLSENLKDYAKAGFMNTDLDCCTSCECAIETAAPDTPEPASFEK